MKIIKPSVEFFGAVPTEYNAALKFIEMAGRTCYKSEDKITEDSAEGFVKKLIKAGHLAMVEHSNFVVRTPKIELDVRGVIGKYLNYYYTDKYLYVGGSLTAWYQRGKEMGWKNLFEPFLHQYGMLFSIGDKFDTAFDAAAPPLQTVWQPCPHDEIPKELHRYSAKFICDRGVSHGLVRHRPCSFDQESTRYVSYGGKNIEFIEPDGFEEWNLASQIIFKAQCRSSESAYKFMVGLTDGCSPQQARAVLPNALKTEIVVTADAAEWAHIRKLRTAKSAHPDMQRVMNMVPWEEFLK